LGLSLAHGTERGGSYSQVFVTRSLGWRDKAVRCRVKDLGFRAQGLGFRVCILVFGFWALCFGFCVLDEELGI
jgi:hypothetical protein